MLKKVRKNNPISVQLLNFQKKKRLLDSGFSKFAFSAGKKISGFILKNEQSPAICMCACNRKLYICICRYVWYKRTKLYGKINKKWCKCTRKNSSNEQTKSGFFRFRAHILLFIRNNKRYSEIFAKILVFLCGFF